MRRWIVFFGSCFIILCPVNLLASSIEYPPSHHFVLIGTVLRARLLLPIDCRFEMTGHMLARSIDPVFNDSSRWENDIVIPAGTILDGRYSYYRGRTAFLTFSVFSSGRTRTIIPYRCQYSSPHLCDGVVQGNIGETIQTPIGYSVTLETVPLIWLPD